MAIEATTPNGHVTLTQLDKLTDSIADKIFTKVDKEDGKGLSTNDFTDTLKTKLEDLDNATDEDINKINAKIAAGNSTDTGEIKFGMATSTADGLMSAEDKAKLDSLQNYTLPVATSDSLGGIKIGNGLEMDADGIVSVNSGYLKEEDAVNTYVTKTEASTSINAATITATEALNIPGGKIWIE